MKKPIYQQLVEKHGLSQAHKYILNAISSGSKVLEIGSSAGYMTKILKEKECLIDIIEVDKNGFDQAKKWANKAIHGSISDVSIQSKITEKYDYILCADVLEHLPDVEDILVFLKSKLKEDGFLLISLPNIAFWNMRIQLFFKGDFTYQESGLLDKTHLRFYTVNGFLQLLHSLKLKTVELYPAEGRVPLEYSIRKVPVIGILFEKFIKPKLLWLNPNLTFYHYVVKVQK